MNITTATPTEIDTRIQELEIELDQVVTAMDNTVVSVRKALGQKANRENVGTARKPEYTDIWPTTVTEALDAARALPADTPSADYYARQYLGLPTVGSVLAQLDTLGQRREEIRTELAPLYARYAAERWSRVYLVTNTNGHVHNTTSCRNCYATTTYYWVTELSGATDEQVVAQAGAQTCLTCYSSVREEIVAGRPCLIEEPNKKAARIERERAAAKKAQVAALKGITNPDGTPVEINDGDSRWSETIKTARAAQIKLVDLMWYQKHYSTTEGRKAAIDILEAALAHKNGTTTAQERTAAEKRLANREKREARY